MSPFQDIRKFKDIHKILKLTLRAWIKIIKGQFSILKWAKMTKGDKTKSQEGSRKVTALWIKRRETHSFGYAWFMIQISVSLL